MESFLIDIVGHNYDFVGLVDEIEFNLLSVHIELETVGNKVHSTTESSYFYAYKPYSGWRTFKDVEPQA